MNHKRFGKLLIPAVIILCMVWAVESWAKSSDLSRTRAKYPAITDTAIDSCNLCHTSSIPALNNYGSAYESNGRSTEALGKIEKPGQDADNDGVPNLVEILNLSFPGSSSSKPAPASANAVQLMPLWSSWKYLDTGAAPAANWKEMTFDDSAWASGSAQLGYGNVGETKTVSYGGNTSQKYVTTYFRGVITAETSMIYSNLKLNILRNDGVVVYLNGTEILRSNMPGGTVGNSTLASASGDAWITTAVNSKLLVLGANVIAVEIHQSSASGSNIGFNSLLEAAADRYNSAKNWMLWQ